MIFFFDNGLKIITHSVIIQYRYELILHENAP